MKNLFSLSLLFVLSFLSTNLLIAQDRFELSPVIGESLNQEEMKRIKIERVVPLWQDNYPDSLKIMEGTSKGNLTLLAFRGNQREGVTIVLPHVKKQQLFRLINSEINSLERSFMTIQARLEHDAKVAVVAEMHSGDNFYLEITAVAGKYLEGTMRNNSVRIGWWEIDQIRIQEKATGERGLYNPNATRYLFAPSAIPLKKREGYYQNIWLGFNSINYGLTDNVSVTAGTEAATLLYGALAGGVVNGFVNVKASGKVAEKVHIGGGILAGGILAIGNKMGSASGRGLGGSLGYGIVTYGSERSNMSFSAAMGRFEGEWTKNPVFVLSGMHQINRKVGLVTENWLIRSRPNYGYRTTSIAISGAMRLISNNISIDLGLVGLGSYLNPVDSDSFQLKGLSMIPIPLPFVGIVYKFQN